MFTHGDPRFTHVFSGIGQVTVVLGRSEACQGDALFGPLAPALGRGERLGGVVTGHGVDSGLDVTRARWSSRSLPAVRRRVEHRFDPSSPGCGADVLRARM
ncbi:hypothetical protein [Nocardiopsis ganjiahuensis]|uniref:hypothetical protein n=1 Tax=Nocardiopsis ganjiahuensis TaxID=239984 RepID=UPI00034919CB|nr:hypothetical protein [Nocardiopsis ganjiahuensis]